MAQRLPLAACATTDGTDEVETPTQAYNGPAYSGEKTRDAPGGPDITGSQTVRIARWVRTDADVDTIDQ